MVRVGSTHQRQGNSETWQCLYGGSGNDLHFTWKEALDNWVEYKKPCNTASGRTGVGEPSQGEFGSEGVRTHLCPKAPAFIGTVELPVTCTVIGVAPPCLQGWGALGTPAPPQQGAGDSGGWQLKHSSASISLQAVLPLSTSAARAERECWCCSKPGCRAVTARRTLTDHSPPQTPTTGGGILKRASK